MKKIGNFKRHAIPKKLLKHIAGGSPATLGSTWQCTNSDGSTVYVSTMQGDLDSLYAEIDYRNDNGGSIVGCESQPIG